MFPQSDFECRGHNSFFDVEIRAVVVDLSAAVRGQSQLHHGALSSADTRVDALDAPDFNAIDQDAPRSNGTCLDRHSALVVCICHVDSFC
ncbi:hypothetical protein PhiBTCVTUL1a_12 [Burkholderia phage phiBtTUL1a]|nr:hypothetical protein PhiBTCVTUL1a_12 [Burkholderia phage phiBtTUL1a]